MVKSKFIHQLTKATEELLRFTSTFVKNELADEIYYIIEPSSRDKSDHLSATELKKLDEINNVEGKLLSFTEVISFLHFKDSVPLWINTEVHLSKNHKTIIKLFCSRRFRKEEELNHKVDKFPPFHIIVSLPPYAKDGKKFDINWHQKTFKLKLNSKIWDLKNWKFLREVIKTKNY